MHRAAAVVGHLQQRLVRKACEQRPWRVGNFFRSGQRERSEKNRERLQRPSLRCAQQPPRLLERRPDAAVLGSFLAFLRSEEHTSELQSLAYLVCRLLLEKKKK